MALDKETFDKESRGLEASEKPAHGYHRRPPQIRNPPGSEASWARSLTDAPIYLQRPWPPATPQKRRHHDIAD
eukprot:9476191-Pyramimonas_sp.AAC.1